jgi:hypothetical protein
MHQAWMCGSSPVLKVQEQAMSLSIWESQSSQTDASVDQLETSVSDLANQWHAEILDSENYRAELRDVLMRHLDAIGTSSCHKFGRRDFPASGWKVISIHWRPKHDELTNPLNAETVRDHGTVTNRRAVIQLTRGYIQKLPRFRSALYNGRQVFNNSNL